MPSLARPNPEQGTAAPALTAANGEPADAGAQQGASQYMAASSAPDDDLEALPPGDAYLDGGIYEGLGADPCCKRLTQRQPNGADARR